MKNFPAIVPAASGAGSEVAVDSATDPFELFAPEPVVRITSPPASSSAAVRAMTPLVSRLAVDSAALAAAPVVSPDGRPPLSLDVVSSRLGPIDWTEAVAIVDVLRELMIARGDVEALPDHSQIAITAPGGVLYTRVGRGAAGPHLARLLHMLTPPQKLPAPLRLFVTKWISASAEHTIQDFADELAFFVRPNRSELIQGVYERAAATTAVSPPSSQAVAPPPEKAQPVPRVRRRPARWVIVSFLLVCAGGGGALFLTGGGADLPRGSSLTSMFAGLRKTAATTVDDIRSRLDDEFAAAKGPVPNPTAAGSSTQPAPRMAPPKRRSRNQTAAAGDPPRAPRVAPSAPSQQVDVPAGTAPAVAATAEPSIEPPGNAVVVIDDAPWPPQVYSSSDGDVVPPVLRSPQLPLPVLAANSGDMNSMELLISEEGTVETVRLVSVPKRMPDMMLLSGAKMWTFRPASRDGRAVRYRLVLSWAATP